MRSLFWKVLALLLLGTLLILASACGQDDPAGDGSLRIITATPRATLTPTITPTPQVPALSAEKLDGTRVDLWYLWEPGTEDLISDLAVDFNTGNPDGIELVTRSFAHWEAFELAVEEAIRNGQPPDLTLADPYQYLAWHAAGAVIDLTPYLESPAYGLDVGEFWPVLLGRDLQDGLRLGFPGLFSARVLLYNQSWAQELGFESPPDSAEDFARQTCAAHLENGDRTGGWIIDRTPGGAAAWLLSFEPALQRSLSFDSAQIVEAYRFLADLRQQGCAWLPFAPYPDAVFAERLGLFYSASSSEIGYVAEAFTAALNRDDWTAIGYPNNQGQPAISVSGQSYVIFETDPVSQTAAWLAVRYLTGAESQRMLAEQGLFLPLDRETAEVLADSKDLPGAWRAVPGLMETARYEPPLAAWRVVRSILQDAQAEVLDERFAIGTISLFMDQLQDLVAEYLNP
jgi:ABC-type glycerol-3-phosphate transport system substrate-binding protein